MTKAYDPPGITDPENVDGLTHQQIVDAFNAVANSTSELITVWKQADADLSASTQGMLAAVRGATDGGWSGASADAAVSMVARYCDAASQLPDLFDEVSLVVTNTAMTAVMAKSFLPPVVTVTADQSSDPEGYDRQTREAETAQAEARRIMAERYVVGFQDQDAKLPTFPAAMAIGDDQAPQVGQPGSSISGGPSQSAVQQSPASIEPAGTESEPEPAVEPSTEPSTDTPTGTGSESASPSSDDSTDTGGQDDSTQAAATTPTSTPTSSTPTPSGLGDPARTATPSGGGSGGGAGVPGGPGGSSPVPSPGAAQPPGSAGAGASQGTRGGMPAAAHAGGSGMHGMPGAAGRGGGRGDDQDKTDKKVSLTHGDNTTELLGVIKSVPPVIGDR